MLDSGRIATAILIIAGLLAAAPACSKKSMMPGMQTLGDGDGPAARVTLFGTLHLELRYLDPDTRARYIREVAGQAGDPFRPDPDGRDPFLVFLFSIENQGVEPTLISPSFATLMDRRGKTSLQPLDTRELGSILAAIPAFTPAVSQRLHPATFNVNSGQHLSKLLVFPAMDRHPRMVEMILPSIISGTRSADAHFPFAVTWAPDP